MALKRLQNGKELDPLHLVVVVVRSTHLGEYILRRNVVANWIGAGAENDLQSDKMEGLLLVDVILVTSDLHSTHLHLALW